MNESKKNVSPITLHTAPQSLHTTSQLAGFYARYISNLYSFYKLNMEFVLPAF